MTIGRERKVETRFARRASTGKGVGIDEAVAAAEARLDGMRDDVREQIGEMIGRMLGAKPTIADDPEALRFVRTEADALVGLCGMFGLTEVEKAAASLCKLYDACQPEWPTAEGVNVHLAAVQLFWTLPADAAALASPQVLQGLHQVAAAARCQPKSHEGIQG